MNPTINKYWFLYRFVLLPNVRHAHSPSILPTDPGGGIDDIVEAGLVGVVCHGTAGAQEDCLNVRKGKDLI